MSGIAISGAGSMLTLIRASSDYSSNLQTCPPVQQNKELNKAAVFIRASSSLASFSGTYTPYHMCAHPVIIFNLCNLGKEYLANIQTC